MVVPRQGRREAAYPEDTGPTEDAASGRAACPDGSDYVSPSPPRTVGTEPHRPDAGVPPPARTSGLAIASLALGVVGLFAVPLIASVVAIFLGMKAQEELARDPALAGEGLAKAGVILGWVGVALVVAGFLLFFVFVALLAA